MNDLMTKSFLSYVDLKKQAMKDIETGPDLEMGNLDPSDGENLSKFFQEVGTIKADMEEINYLLIDLQDLNEETRSAQSSKILRGLRDRINSDMVMVLRKAKIIKTRLENLDSSNIANRALYEQGSHVDRTRVSVTNGLRIKLKGLMDDFQCLRQKIVDDHKEGLKRRYQSVTGENPSDKAIEKMMSGDGLSGVFEEKGEISEENRVRDEGMKELQRSLVELHKVFLDMAVMVEVQGDKMNNIEENVASAGVYVGGATRELDRANKMKRRRTWACWIVVVVLVFLLVSLIAILF
ncbi:hypothetical protein OROGR_020136 [Orobanche gracilis]